MGYTQRWVMDAAARVVSTEHHQHHQPRYVRAGRDYMASVRSSNITSSHPQQPQQQQQQQQSQQSYRKHLKPLNKHSPHHYQPPHLKRPESIFSLSTTITKRISRDPNALLWKTAAMSLGVLGSPPSSSSAALRLSALFDVPEERESTSGKEDKENQQQIKGDGKRRDSDRPSAVSDSTSTTPATTYKTYNLNTTKPSPDLSASASPDPSDSQKTSSKKPSLESINLSPVQWVPVNYEPSERSWRPGTLKVINASASASAVNGGTGGAGGDAEKRRGSAQLAQGLGLGTAAAAAKGN
ncbi:hypothetical protein HK102_012520, partial [Quaeritorhiza haematococci]